MKIVWRILVLAAAATTMVGCGGGSTRPEDPAVAGVVVDGGGRPVVGAAIVMEYHLEHSWNEKSWTDVSFVIPSAGHVRLWLGDDCRDEVVRVLVDGLLPAGQHSYAWDGKDAASRRVRSGLYRYHLEYGGEEHLRDAFLARTGYPPVTDPAAYRSHAETDAEGHFSFPQDCLPFGHVMEARDETGLLLGESTVTRRVMLYALHAGHTTGHSEWVDIDPVAGQFVRIVLGD